MNNNIYKVLLTTIGVFFGIYALLLPATATHLFLLMFNLLLYIILNFRESKILSAIGNLFIISIILIAAEFILEIILMIRLNLILLKISAFSSILALIFSLIFYLFSFIKEILESIEIKLKK